MAEIKALDIGRQLEVMVGSTPPQLDGHPMTVGELLVRVIPVVNSGSDYMRAWNLASDIDRALGAGEATFELRADDLRTLRRTVIDQNHHELWGQNWVKANLDMAFEEAARDDNRGTSSKE